jgi:hypothetical protein
LHVEPFRQLDVITSAPPGPVDPYDAADLLED